MKLDEAEASSTDAVLSGISAALEIEEVEEETNWSEREVRDLEILILGIRFRANEPVNKRNWPISNPICMQIAIFSWGADTAQCVGHGVHAVSNSYPYQYVSNMVRGPIWSTVLHMDGRINPISPGCQSNE